MTCTEAQWIIDECPECPEKGTPEHTSLSRAFQHVNTCAGCKDVGVSLREFAKRLRPAMQRLLLEMLENPELFGASQA